MAGFSLIETIVLILLLGILWSIVAINPASFSKNNLAIKQAIALIRETIIATGWDQTSRVISDFSKFKIEKLKIKSKDQKISIYPNHSCSPALITHTEAQACAFTLSLRCNIRLLC